MLPPSGLRTRKSWTVPLLLAAALAAACFLLYLPAIDFDYAGIDDSTVVRDSPVVAKGLTPAGIKAALAPPPVGGLWAPLTNLSLQADASLWGMDPRAFHRTNIVLFALAAAALLLVFWRMTNDLVPSAFAAALFAFHPLRVESVAWIVERKDVLSLLLVTLTLALYLRYAQNQSRRSYIGVLVLFALALAAKPSVAAFPLLLLVFDFWPLQRGGTEKETPGRARVLARLLLEKAPLLLLSGGAVTLTVAMFHGGSPLADPWQRLQCALVSPFLYLRDTVWPAGLHFKFFHPSRLEVRWEVTLGAAALHLGVLYALWRARRPWLTAGWAGYLIALLPTGGLVALGSQWLSDRFTLLPHLGLALAFAWAGKKAVSRAPRALAALGAAALLLALAGVTRSILPSWKNGVTLMERSVAYSPGEPRGLRDLALALAERGRLGEAAGRYAEALQKEPPPELAVLLHFEYGLLLRRSGQRDEAVLHLQEAAAMQPGNPVFLLKLGGALVDAGRPEEAIAPVRTALEAVPGDRRNRLVLARLLLSLGRAGEAGAEFARVAGDPAATLQESEEARSGLAEAGVR